MENGKKKVTITLPESLVTQAKAEGLLRPGVVEQLLREEIRRRKMRELMATADKLAKGKIPFVPEEEVVAIVHEVRKEQRSRNATRP